MIYKTYEQWIEEQSIEDLLIEAYNNYVEEQINLNTNFIEQWQ